MERTVWRGRPAWAEIDLDAIEFNVRQLRRLVPDQVRMAAVVKGNAYGHGAVPVARTALAAGADSLAVACTDEGIQLRQAGIDAPIVVLDYVSPWQADEVVENNLTVTVNTRQLALALSARATALGIVANVHVKVETGMGRFGLPPNEVVPFVRDIIALPNLYLEGLWTHFATADERDQAFARQQLATYLDTVRMLADNGIDIPCRHLANSAATMELPESHLDMVRCGIAMYGLYPSAEVRRDVPLRPALTLKARIARLQELPAGSSISYGRTFIADRPLRVALVPLGYADGVSRQQSNRGAVLIGGRRVPIVGRICMDQFVANVQDISNLTQGDEVVIIGPQGKEELTADEVAAVAGTISYEVVCAISARVPRIYLKNGVAIGASTLIDHDDSIN